MLAVFVYEAEHYPQPAFAGGLKGWIVHWLMGMLKSSMPHSSGAGLVPCSRLKLGGSLRVPVAGLQKAVCFFLEASVNPLSLP